MMAASGWCATGICRSAKSNGIGPVAVRCPWVRDRTGEGPERIRFLICILPPYAHRSKSLDVLIPILYLNGVFTGDFE
jgi:putative transposase